MRPFSAPALCPSPRHRPTTTIPRLTRFFDPDQSARRDPLPQPRRPSRQLAEQRQQRIRSGSRLIHGSIRHTPRLEHTREPDRHHNQWTYDLCRANQSASGPAGRLGDDFAQLQQYVSPNRPAIHAERFGGRRICLHLLAGFNQLGGRRGEPGRQGAIHDDVQPHLAGQLCGSSQAYE